MHDTFARLGSSLARILTNRDHSQDHILVQLVLQGISLSVSPAPYPLSVPHFLRSQIRYSDIIGWPLQVLFFYLVQITPNLVIAKTSTHIVKMVFSHTPAYRCQVSSLIEYSTAELTDTILGRSSGILLITVCISYATPSPTASLSSSSYITTSTASPGYPNAKLPKTSLLSLFRGSAARLVRLF
jgi:hypothetical protein